MPSSRPLLRLSFVFVTLLACGSGSAAAQTQPADRQDDAASQVPQFKDDVQVVGVTPIHGLGVRQDKVPVNVQVATSSDLSQTGGVDLSEQLSLGLASVHLNETQTNPFQPDLQFRGFAVSPLLGLPQGLAIYQNGVRVNEPFGDTVNWDLLPVNAIATLNLMPGSNPLFGLNALGGALSLQTKTGFSHPGHAVRVLGGSFGRRWVEGESGGHGERFSYFVAGRLLSEDGWRDFSPSRLRQLFGDVTWRGDKTTLGISLTAGANRLIGNGPAPEPLLEERRASIFTHRDETKNETSLLTLRGRRDISPRLSIDAVAFVRPGSTRTFNGDDTAYDGCEDPELDDLLCADEGEGLPVRRLSGGFVAFDPANPFDATNNTSRTTTRGWGGSVQASLTQPVRGRENDFLIGVSLDEGRARYESATELAALTESRGTEGTGIFDEDARVNLRATVRHGGVYLADFFSLTPKLTVSGSARLTHSAIDLRDRIGDALTGDHSFTRLNPAAGATYALPGGITAYGSYATASRVPTPSELSCADPEDPCRLPNGFVADPPLLAVQARTWEGGIRGRTGATHWAASIFHTSNSDDIIFISSGALTNEGYFANVGDTRRRGIELDAFGSLRPLRWAAAYTYVSGQFDTPLTVSSPNHPEAADGEIDVPSGSFLPGIPRHNVKAQITATVGRTSLGATLTYTSSQFLRGDEGNLLEPIGGSALVNLMAGVRLQRRVHLVGRVTNLFNREYATFGLLGDADDVLGDDFDSARFVSPGAPRAAWIGIELSLPR